MSKRVGKIISACCLLAALSGGHAVKSKGQTPALKGRGDTPSAKNDKANSFTLERARALVKAGQRDEAIKLYQGMMADAPSDQDVRVELARLLTGEMATRLEAEKLFRAAALAAPRDGDLALERAANLVAAGDSVNAVIEYRRAYELNPNDTIALDNYLRQLSRLGATPVAIKQLTKTLSQTTTNYPARMLLAHLLRSEARYTDAVEQFNLAARGGSETQNEIALRGAAQSWLALGYAARAEQIFNQINSVNGPGNAAAFLVGRARTLLDSGRYEAAVQLLNSQSTIAEKDYDALLLLADCYRAAKQTPQERGVLEKIQTQFPRSALDLSLLERLARVYYELGDKANAEKNCAQMLAEDPREAVATLGLKLLGLSETVKTTTAPAVDLKANTAARQSGFDAEAAEAALFWRRYDLAVPLLRRALNARTDSPRLSLSLGAALLETNETSEAARIFAQVAITDGARLDALLGWAEAETRNKRPKEALEIYDEALRLDAANFRLMLGQAQAYAALGDDDRAAVLLNQLASRAPESETVAARLESALLSLGRSYRDDNRGTNAALVMPKEPMIAADDTLLLKVAGKERYNTEVTVDERGQIRLPYLSEPITAKCATERELGAMILAQGGARLIGATVNARIVSFGRAPLVVAGAVYLPGGYFVKTSLDLRESLMLASGPNRRAGRSVFLLRGATTKGAACARRTQELWQQMSGEVEVYSRAEAEEGIIKLRQPLRAGDLLYVPESRDAFVVGAVARPGIIRIVEQLTLRDAIRSLGGALTAAQVDRIKLSRLRPSGAVYQQFIIDLTQIERQIIGDVIVQPGDIIEIPTTSNRGDVANSFATLIQTLALNAQQPTTRTQSQTVVNTRPTSDGQEEK